MRFKYVCNDCGAEYASDDIRYVCPKCAGMGSANEFRQGNLNVVYDRDDLRAVAARADFKPQDFLPFAVDDGPFPIFETPLVKPLKVCASLGLENLRFKLDSLLPSGSFKDRASQAVIGQARHFGQDCIALASTGNAGAAMSALGAAYSMRIALFVPQTAPINKLMQSVLYGAEVVPVKGTYDDAFSLSICYTELFGGINRNTAYNPITIEGKKTVSIELYRQFGGKAPDAVYVPVGDGCIISGVAKGFADLMEAGLIDKLPHLVAVQSDKSNAIAKAWETGEFLNLSAATTIADSISVASPAAGRQAVGRIKQSGGWCVQVSDDEIKKAQLALVKESAVFVEPAAAAAYAGLVKDRDNLVSRLGAKARVVCLLTGIGFKDMKVFDGAVKMPEPIENSRDAVKERFGA